MRVTITGANGFIGRALAGRLRDHGHTVGGVDLHADPAAGVVAGDISADGDWQHQVAGSDLVIHTAAIVSNAVGLPGQWRINVAGTRKVVEAATRGKATRFVHLSSVRAFSEQPEAAGQVFTLTGGGVGVPCRAVPCRARNHSPQPYRRRSRPEALRTVRLRSVPLPLRANIE